MGAHVLCTNNRSRSRFELPVDDDITLERRFGRMDGDRLFAFAMWLIPPGAEFGDPGRNDAGAEEYIQCAGRADRLTVELRTSTDDGPRHVVLGDPTTVAGPRDVVIEWADHQTEIHRSERFDAAGASQLFLEFYEHGDVVAAVTRRPLDLS